VVPTCEAASSAFLTSGSDTSIWSAPERCRLGSATPIWSTRLRMMSSERSMASPVTADCLVGLAW
jgi:hypothetical protein